MKWIITTAVLGIFALLHIPAYQSATQEFTQPFTTHSYGEVTPTTLKHEGNGFYEGDIAYSMTTEHWTLNCGSWWTENDPPITTFSHEEAQEGTAPMALYADSRKQAVEEATADVHSWYSEEDDLQDIRDAALYCADDRADQKWDVILSSPEGWLGAAFIAFLIFGIGSGGGGGTRIIRGTISPRLWGGGWWFRGR